MYENVCYKTLFLKEVIFRIDFPSPLEGIEKQLPNKLTKAILEKFPISEPQKTHAQEFQFAGPNFQSKTSEIMQWVFHGENRKKSLTIEPTSFVILVRDYKSYEDFIEDFNHILTVLFNENKDITAGRVGLRYVNLIDLNEPEPLEWKKHVNEQILGIIDFHEEKQFLTRIFHIVEYNFDGLSVKYQFGIANSDYPAQIKKKQFVLDIDAYSHGAFDYGDILNCVEDAHVKIQDIFERSITDETRQLMKQKNDVQ
ncbi:conserved hypothetical protein [Bathymodiolus platifrons methanotrophic gill symbiont]|uniref:TIGR04255 family protein n=1 Tax=Bathymodiolus platifrons methanotrophic gill symbiont TaxID=113268 RepID=UPI000B416C84|nr:TIGR04255 family protein [Bathymodiolus platifrons methanotrophic gill symbiont]GAW87814.1 conserved hypothetical protein [Bathymodiolus platifrons methanotrophic gill symbiont]